ncbi:hypothetical protein NMY22_g17928 [Coprinellus aureogranulatus]|nr:hypothetical protein NMY22_g17928 [Coprinellus aureogranulatus]
MDSWIPGNGDLSPEDNRVATSKNGIYATPDDPFRPSFPTASLALVKLYIRQNALRHTANTTPFTLAHVCASWRAIVTGNPTLWSKLCAFRAQPCDIPLFQFWLSLSAGAPLDFAIWQRYKEQREEDVDTVAHTLLLLALEHSDRWKSVRLRLTQDMEPLLTAAGKPLPMSSLQSVDLDIWDWSPEGLRSFVELLSASSTLRDVSLGSIDQSSPFMGGLPWANIRKIDLPEIQLTDLLSLLRFATSLEHLSVIWVHGKRCTLAAPATNTPIHLPFLTTVELKRYYDAPALLDMLSAPSLSTLSLDSGLDTTRGTGNGWKSLHDLMQRSGSGCRIQSLCWHDRHLPEEALIEHFKKGSGTTFSKTRHLKIRTSVGIKMVEALTLRPGNNRPLFPSLEWLELEFCLADAGALQDMISSRPLLRRVEIVAAHEQNGPRTIAFFL